jgi:replicative DNA helicase
VTDQASSHSKSKENFREPPYSVDYEQALLAACMLEGGQDSLTKCIDIKISPNSFYIPSHAEIYKVCLGLYEAGSPINELTVAEQLKTCGKLDRIGGYAYLNEVNNRIETPAHLTFYAKKVKELELARRLVRFFLTGLDSAYGGIVDIDQFLEDVEHKVLEIGEDRVAETAAPIEVSMSKAVNTVQRLLAAKGSISGVSTGFDDLDTLTFGLHRTEMIVLAARPSMGKTALALNIAEAAVLGTKKKDFCPIPTLFFSLEMSAEQLAMRMLCGRARINMSKLREGFLRKEHYQTLASTASEIKKAPLWIDESTNITILEMRAKARRIKVQCNLGFIVIDYLQLIAGADPKAPREQQIAEISRGLKAMAKELNVPVLVLSQLNRESEKERRQPRLSDLRESGAIEQDADLVLLLSKKIKEDTNVQENLNDTCVLRELIIAKQRNGPVGIIPLVFLKHFTRFENYTGEIYEEMQN